MPNTSNCKGFAPVILIVVLTVVIAGAVGASYFSKKDVSIKQDGKAETGQSSQNSSSLLKIAPAEDLKEGLTDKPYKLKIEGGTLAVPEFSIFSPSGWVKLSPSGDNVVAFEAPGEDKITFGAVYFYMKPRVNIHILKRDYQNLDAFLQDSKASWVQGNIEITNTQKTQLAGKEAYSLEGIMDVGEIGKTEFETQMREEIAKSGQKLPEEEIAKNLNQALENFKVKIIGYIIYEDGYGITVSGKALLPVWDRREGQLKESMNTFKLLD